MEFTNGADEACASSSLELSMATAKEAHELIKNSQFLNSSLPDLLSRAPVAAHFMGMLHILASSEAATKADLIKPGTLVKHQNLPANLNALVHEGMNSFETASRSMKTISLAAQEHFGSQNSTIMKIVGSLSDERQAKALLGFRMNQLKTGVNKCSDAARIALDGFDKWKKMAEELEQLTFSGLDSAEKQRRAREMEDKKKRILLAHQEKKKQEAEAEVKLYKQRVEERERDYKEAVKKTGSVKRAFRDVLLAESLNTVFLVPNTAKNIVESIPGVVKEGLRTVGNLGSFGGAGKAADPPSAPASSTNGATEATTDDPIASDPALQAAGSVVVALEQLQEAWTGDGLELARDDDSPLQTALERIAALDNEMSRLSTPEAQRILATTLKPALEVGRSARNALQQNPEVSEYQGLRQGWEEGIVDPLNRARILKTTADLQPGRGFGVPMPLLPHLRTPLAAAEGNFGKSISSTMFLQQRRRP